MIEEETLLEQMTKVRPEVLNENALKLFNKIMKVIDERDELQQKLTVVNKMNEDNYNDYCKLLKENAVIHERINKAIDYLKRKQNEPEILLGGDVDDE